MELSGEVQIDGVSTDDAWAVFSDPAVIRDSIPGCKRLAPAREADGSGAGASISGSPAIEDPERTFVEGEEYTAVIQAGTRSIKPKFETVVHITERAFPRMSAHIEGAGGESAFDMDTEVEFVETAAGVSLVWESEFDIAGRLGQVDSSMISLVSQKMVDHFFGQIEQRIEGTPT